MAIGPGKYDDVCSLVRHTVSASGVVVIILDGKFGHGFSCQGDATVLKILPDMLEKMAKQIREDMKL